MTSRLFPLLAASLGAVIGLAGYAGTGWIAVGLCAALAAFAAALALRNWWIAEEERPLLAEELLGLHDTVDVLKDETIELRELLTDLAAIVEEGVAAAPGADGLSPNAAHALVNLSKRLDAQEARAEKLAKALSIAVAENRKLNDRLDTLEQDEADAPSAAAAPENVELEPDAEAEPEIATESEPDTGPRPEERPSAGVFDLGAAAERVLRGGAAPSQAAKPQLVAAPASPQPSPQTAAPQSAPLAPAAVHPMTEGALARAAFQPAPLESPEAEQEHIEPDAADLADYPETFEEPQAEARPSIVERLRAETERSDAERAAAADATGAPHVHPAPAQRLFDRAPDIEARDLFLTPTLTLPERKPRFFEAATRLRGADEEPERFAADNAVLVWSAGVAAKLRQADEQVAVFCDLSIETLRDPSFLDAAAAFLAEPAPEASDQRRSAGVVLEFSQLELGAIGHGDVAALERLAATGVRLSLDHIVDWSVDIDRLARIGFRYLKLDSAEFLERVRAAGGSAERLLSAFDRIGLELIVEKIETQTELDDVLVAGARLGQGAALAAPRRVKAV